MCLGRKSSQRHELPAELGQQEHHPCIRNGGQDDPGYVGSVPGNPGGFATDLPLGWTEMLVAVLVWHIEPFGDLSY